MAERRKFHGNEHTRSGAGTFFRKLFASRGWRVYGAGVCLCLAAAVIFLAGIGLDSHWTRQAEERRAELQVEVDLAASERMQSLKEQDSGDPSGVQDGTQGVSDGTRKAKDDMVVSDMLSHATTWNGRASYEASRKELLTHYSWLTMESNPDFLSRFFAPGEELYYKLDGEILGDPLEDGRNITFSSVTTYLLDESDDGVRTYFGEAVTQSKGQVGGVYEAQLAVTYTTRPDGSVWDMRCYQL